MLPMTEETNRRAVVRHAAFRGQGSDVKMRERARREVRLTGPLGAAIMFDISSEVGGQCSRRASFLV